MGNQQNKGQRFIYFYFNRNEPEKIHQVVPAHVEYWRSLNMEGYMGGPFTDRTGGLISFLASNLEEAEEIMRQDPFVSADLIEQKWIKQWIVESHAAA